MSRFIKKYGWAIFVGMSFDSNNWKLWLFRATVVSVLVVVHDSEVLRRHEEGEE